MANLRSLTLRLILKKQLSYFRKDDLQKSAVVNSDIRMSSVSVFSIFLENEEFK